MKEVIYFILVAASFCLITHIVNIVLIRRRKNNKCTSQALINYECGSDKNQNPYYQDNFKFYLLLAVFITFELELIYLIPFVELFKNIIREEGLFLKKVLLLEVSIFIIVLVLGLVYILKSGVLSKIIKR